MTEASGGRISDKEKEFDFAQARVTLRMQDVKVSSVL